MGLLSRVGQLVKGLNPGNASFLGLALNGGAGRSFTGKVVTQELALKISAVYACVRNLSEDVAKLKPEIWQLVPTPYGDGVKKVKAENHPLRALMLKPNKFQDRFQFFETVMFALTLRGNAYILLIKNRRGVVTSMIPIHPDRVTIMEGVDGDLFYRITSNGAFERAQLDAQSFVVPARNIIHVRGLSGDGINGYSPLQAAANAFSLASTAEEQAEGLFARGARPGGALTHPEKISKEAAQRLTDSWNSVFGGSENAGKSILLEEGMDWKPLGMTSLDAEFLATRRFEVEEIARFFRMPLHMIGDLSRATNNNIAHQGMEYYTNTLSGYLERLEAAISSAFDLGDEFVFEFDTWALMRLDLASMIKAFSEGKHAGLIKSNEARWILGFNPVKGGDELAQPLNMGTPGGKPAASTKPPGEVEPPEEEEDEEDA